MSTTPPLAFAPISQRLAKTLAEPPAARALASYYLIGTPLFFLADLALGVSIRAAFLDDEPMLRFLYYALAFGCGLVAVRRPDWSGMVGLIECGANIILLVLGVMLAYFAALDAVLADAPISSSFGPTSAVNLALAGAMIAVSYIRHRARPDA